MFLAYLAYIENNTDILTFYQKHLTHFWAMCRLHVATCGNMMDCSYWPERRSISAGAELDPSASALLQYFNDA